MVVTSSKCFLASSSPRGPPAESLWWPRQGVPRRVKIWRTFPVVKPVVLPMFIQSLKIHQPVKTSAGGTFAMVSRTLSLSTFSSMCLYFFPNRSRKGTFYLRMLVGTSHENCIFSFFVIFIFISIVLSLFLLAFLSFPKFITYLDYLLNCCVYLFTELVEHVLGMGTLH